MCILFRCICKHFISDHTFYINSVIENIVNSVPSYYILQLYVNILYFLMYSPIIVINVAETCNLLCFAIYCNIGQQPSTQCCVVVLTAVVLFCWKDNICVWKGRQKPRWISTHNLWQHDVSNNYHNLHLSCNFWSSLHCLKDGSRDNKKHRSSSTSVSSIFVSRKIYSNDSL
jgi:hypothetical protein